MLRPPSRFVWLTLAGALAGCGPNALKHAGHKAVVYARPGADPNALGTLTLRTSICQLLERDRLTATLGGRPLQLVDLGAPDVNPDGSCSQPTWTETVPTPVDEADTPLEISDGTETLHLTFHGLNQPPVASVVGSARVSPGGVLKVQLDSAHAQDVVTGATFVANKSGTRRAWHASQTAVDHSAELAVPDDTPTGPGSVTLQISAVIAADCDADVVCQEPTMNVAEGSVSTVTQVEFVTAPLSVNVRP